MKRNGGYTIKEIEFLIFIASFHSEAIFLLQVYDIIKKNNYKKVEKQRFSIYTIGFIVIHFRFVFYL